MKDQLFNRKALFSLLAVVMCLGFTAMSYGQAVVSVDPAEVESPAAGEQLMVNINVAGGEGVLGYEVDISYDPTALSFVESANADYLPAGAFATPAVESEGGVKISAASLAGAAPDADGTLATLTFEVVEAKASTIGIATVILAGANDTTIEATTMDGMVTVPAAEEETTEETTEEVTEETTEETTEEVTEETTEGTTEEGTEETTEETTEEVTEETTEETTEEVTEETTEETTEEVTEETTEETTEEVTEETTEETTEVEMPVSQMFEITLTNLTEGVHGESGQTLSPAIFAAHPAGVKLAVVGEPANEAIVMLAEGGSTAGLEALAAAAGADIAIAMNEDMTRRYTMPGQSSTVTLTADMVNSSLSVGSMLVSTNDAFIAAIDVPLFDADGMPVSTTIELMAYDAGSEDNTEMASDIPGPLGLDAEVDPPGS